MRYFRLFYSHEWIKAKLKSAAAFAYAITPRTTEKSEKHKKNSKTTAIDL
jgi:hypothetical protein